MEYDSLQIRDEIMENFNRDQVTKFLADEQIDILMEVNTLIEQDKEDTKNANLYIDQMLRPMIHDLSAQIIESEQDLEAT